MARFLKYGDAQKIAEIRPCLSGIKTRDLITGNDKDFTRTPYFSSYDVNAV